MVKGTLQTSSPKSPINILLARQLWAHSSPKPREETKKHSINFKFQTTFNIFSLFTSYAITLLVKVTYVQVWLEPCRQASALEKVKQVPPKASKKWKSHKWNEIFCTALLIMSSLSEHKTEIIRGPHIFFFPLWQSVYIVPLAKLTHWVDD